MRFFATTISEVAGNLELVPTGTPHENLLEDILNDARYARLGLEIAAGYLQSVRAGRRRYKQVMIWLTVPAGWIPFC